MNHTVTQEQYIDIGIGEERYAIRIEDIQEIIRWQDVTRLPSSKPYIKGVINLRSKIVPIISLRNRFGMAEEAHTKSTRILIINHVNESVGIIVDRVNQVITIPDIQPQLERGGGPNNSWITGFGRTPAGLVCILKLEGMFQSP